MTPYFCDGLKDVTILNGTARLEFHRLLPGADGELQVATEVLVALPTQGLIQMLSILEQVREHLVREQSVGDSPADAYPQDEPRTSPNFG
jgi:hypothetical protein